ncbi:tic62 protein isoform X1 [Zea mays]|uniref:NAD(P)-binding domain-containing protein n=1 Tax=Zea mays TaxID=4577 RepID=A0A804MX65_MAIZE|nr:tic62 protein isoform X1 [Zea mays]|eukprot:XP_020403291.1 tic62 protein isoform X1 [Zea mays]
MDTIVSLSPQMLRQRQGHQSTASSSSSAWAITTARIGRHLSTASSCSSPRLLIKQRATAASAPAQKEKEVVFVAGATGRVGSRAVRELMKLGFRVRAAVRNAQRATSLVQRKSSSCLSLWSVTWRRSRRKASFQPSAMLPWWCAPSVQARRRSWMSPAHTASTTWPPANLYKLRLLPSSLFWGVLFWKRRAEEALIASGIPYTIIRPGGMERPTDAYKETHNLVLAPEDTYVGGQVSNLQVAELIGCMATNRSAAYCKTVEAVAEITAPLLPMEQLLSAIPSKREQRPADR